MSEIKPGKTSVKTIALIGSYVPRQCGIATFTKDLRDAIAAEIGERQTTVVAIDDLPGGYAYPPEVRLQMPQHKQAEYTTAAELLNINQIDVAILEHEFGLFGGRDGSHILDLVRQLRMPVITTLHTVLAEPSPGQRAVMKELARESDRLVVMSNMASDLLQRSCDVPAKKIAIIPHGIPDVPFVDPHFYSDQFGVEGKRVLLTFGLLSRGKGIETAIRAMPKIVAAHPEVVYIVLGATHPHVLRAEGNEYRDSLERLVAQLKMQENVRFHNRFVTLSELCAYIGVADIYISPYPNKEQITSGTLSYALGAGKVIVSTPYWHAQELLAEDRGRFFPFGDSEKLAETVIGLLDNDSEMHAIRKRAYLHCRPMVWSQVGRAYLGLAERILRDRRRSPRPLTMSKVVQVDLTTLPDLNIAHLRRLSDDTGIFQHAIYGIPHREHGYCTDDNARALIAALTYHDMTRDDSILPLVDVYFSFIQHAFNARSRRFRNFMSFDRKWLEEVGSEDCHGRVIWALGTAAMLGPNDAAVSLATRLFHDALEPIESFASPRSWAHSLVGIQHYLSRFGGDTLARRLRQTLADKLYGLFRAKSAPQWPWCEDSVTYDNAKLPHALLVAGAAIDNDAMVKQGLESLEWLVNLQTTPNHLVSLIGSNGWYERSGKRARFDQQPIDAAALVEACAEAYRITAEPKWYSLALMCFGWFAGNNELNASLYDYQTGGCRDGLNSDGPNLNEGAESSLAWLTALMTVMDLKRARSLQEASTSSDASDDAELNEPAPDGTAAAEAPPQDQGTQTREDSTAAYSTGG